LKVKNEKTSEQGVFESFTTFLRDGILLCELINVIYWNDIKRG